MGDPPRCRRCHHDHDQVDVVTWLWSIRDVHPKPPAAQLAAVVMLASRLDPRSGCGWLDNRTVAEDTGKASLDVVERATRWARDHFLLHRAVKGGNAGGRTTKTLWFLTTTAPQSSKPRQRGDEGGSDPLWSGDEITASNPRQGGDENHG